MKNVFNYDQFDARVIIGSLTPRERSIVEKLVLGETPTNIAESFGIERKTVEVYIASIRKKFGVTQVYMIPRIWFCGMCEPFDSQISAEVN